MDDKLLSLSFSVEANKGVYALLLGSGISFTSGIPTGWGILTELCRRIMRVNNADEEDAIKWYQEKYGKPPLYDEVIERLARTSSERQGLLKEFFEPTEEDIEEKRKLPTEAHRAIAQLVKEGYIRVIVTTNFDRLIEQALDELSVQYQILYHESDIDGMKPLAHSECTILKIHGDYRDTRFKNVTDELQQYSDSLTELLQRIFDEYGIITSGWSAEWDTALRDTIKSVKGRRYSWYWHSFTKELNSKAQDLVSFRDGNIILDNKGADHFFKQLLENVQSISEIKKTNPESLQIKIQKFKKYLTNGYEMGISELITNETKIVLEYFNTINFNEPSSIEVLNQRIQEIKDRTKTLATLVYILANNACTPGHERILIETLERLTFNKYNNGTPRLLDLQKIPLQVILYCSGIALTKNENYETLDKIFVKPRVRDNLNNHWDFATYTAPSNGLHDLFSFLYSANRYYLPVEEFIHSYLKDVLLESQLMFDVVEYDIFYDIFEFLRSIKCRHLGKDYQFYSGRFGYKHDKRHIESLLKEGSLNKEWKVLALFNYDYDDFKKAFTKLVDDFQGSYKYNTNGLMDFYEEPSNS